MSGKNNSSSKNFISCDESTTFYPDVDKLILKKAKSEIILDHHLLRDLKYKEIYPELYKTGKKRVKTFAEYLGKENNTLEAHRKQLWGK